MSGKSLQILSIQSNSENTQIKSNTFWDGVGTLNGKSTEKDKKKEIIPIYSSI